MPDQRQIRPWSDKGLMVYIVDNLVLMLSQTVGAVAASDMSHPHNDYSLLKRSLYHNVRIARRNSVPPCTSHFHLQMCKAGARVQRQNVHRA